MKSFIKIIFTLIFTLMFSCAASLNFNVEENQEDIEESDFLIILNYDFSDEKVPYADFYNISDLENVLIDYYTAKELETLFLLEEDVIEGSSVVPECSPDEVALYFPLGMKKDSNEVIFFLYKTNEENLEDHFFSTLSLAVGGIHCKVTSSLEDNTLMYGAEEYAFTYEEDGIAKMFTLFFD